MRKFRKTRMLFPCQRPDFYTSFQCSISYNILQRVKTFYLLSPMSSLLPTPQLWVVAYCPTHLAGTFRLRLFARWRWSALVSFAFLFPAHCTIYSVERA